MKARLVYENLDFERGRDAKKTIGIGLEVLKKETTELYFKFLGLVQTSEFLDYQGKFGNEALSLIPKKYKNSHGWGNLNLLFPLLSSDEFMKFYHMINKWKQILNL